MKDIGAREQVGKPSDCDAGLTSMEGEKGKENCEEGTSDCNATRRKSQPGQ